MILVREDVHLFRASRFYLPGAVLVDLCQHLGPFLERPTTHSNSVPVETQDLSAVGVQPRAHFSEKLEAGLALSNQLRAK